jgi:hypothetical protein
MIKDKENMLIYRLRDGTDGRRLDDLVHMEEMQTPQTTKHRDAEVGAIFAQLRRVRDSSNSAKPVPLRRIRESRPKQASVSYHLPPSSMSISPRHGYGFPQSSALRRADRSTRRLMCQVSENRLGRPVGRNPHNAHPCAVHGQLAARTMRNVSPLGKGPT